MQQGKGRFRENTGGQSDHRPEGDKLLRHWRGVSCSHKVYFRSHLNLFSFEPLSCTLNEKITIS